MLILDMAQYAFDLGRQELAKHALADVKQKGQFLTSPTVARFMVQQIGPIQNGCRILEPALGSGVLVCALVEAFINQGQAGEIWIDGYEIDPDLAMIARQVLTQLAQKAALAKIKLNWQVFEADFVINCAPTPQPALLLDFGIGEYSYDLIIANPPYFKLNSNDSRAHIATGNLTSHTNIYTLFMAIAAHLLKPDGRACFIVPRSFCSGLYFSKFRRDFMRQVRPVSFHIFEMRGELFKNDDVLQENIIVTFDRRDVSNQLINDPAARIAITTARSSDDLAKALNVRYIDASDFIGQPQGGYFFRLPVSDLDDLTLKTLDTWPETLQTLGLDVSTGPVVAFRASSFLSAEAQACVPLIWMQHVQPNQVIWPLATFKKPQYIRHSYESQSLLTHCANSVLLRRFSAKEDHRRLIAAPLLSEQLKSEAFGLENHINYIYRRNGQLSPVEAVGLAALLNSPILDRYFRIVNGNTQVNAAELLALPLPPLAVIQSFGQHVQNTPPPDIEATIYAILWQTGWLPEEMPILWETRMTMHKIEQARAILAMLGLPPAQRNEISALTLLVLAQISEETPWHQAAPRNLRVHDILAQIRDRYQRSYAENTRETIRRQVLHQFEQAGLIIRNPEDATLATNSPRTHYRLSDIVVDVLQQYETEAWQTALENFHRLYGSLQETYTQSKQRQLIPVKISDGASVYLSPGKHNQLQSQIIHEFAPRFMPGSRLLYLGDTASKSLVFEHEAFERLGLLFARQDKLPDIILYDQDQNLLCLVEAVTSHGPVSPKRHLEIEAMFLNHPLRRIYVSAFVDLKTFNRFSADIAWGTEVWVAQIPNHMIHFNGEKFLRPDDAE